ARVRAAGAFLASPTPGAHARADSAGCVGLRLPRRLQPGRRSYQVLARQARVRRSRPIDPNRPRRRVRPPWMKRMLRLGVSLRTRLTLWYGALLALTLLAFSAFLYFTLQQSLSNSVDQRLTLR